MSTTVSRRAWLAAAAFGAARAAGLRATQHSATHGEQPEPRFRGGIDLVRLSVTGRDGAGRIVHDLRPEDFSVMEDGVDQEIAHFGHHESPISVVVLFDRSGSMDGDKLMHAKDAIVNFMEALHTSDETLLIAFSDALDQLGEFGLDAKTIARATKELRAGGGTRLYDAVLEGATAIAMPDRHEKRALLILSDGEDTASRSRSDAAVDAVRHAAVPVYAIGIGMEGPAPAVLGAPTPADGSTEAGSTRASRTRSSWTRLGDTGPVAALKAITDGTGGWTYPIVAAKRCKEVCLLVADELRNQYLLAYYPTNDARDALWRTVSVRTSRPGVTLFTRTGLLRAWSESWPRRRGLNRLLSDTRLAANRHGLGHQGSK